MKHVCFIGRWCPLHKGHKKLIKVVYERKKLPVLILVRDTEEDLSTKQRVNIINKWMDEEGIVGLVMVIPDIEGVYFGRGVGYNVEEVDLDEEIKNISGTMIREMLRMGDLENVAKNTLDEDEEKLIEERLKELGYLE